MQEATQAHLDAMAMLGEPCPPVRHLFDAVELPWKYDIYCGMYFQGVQGCEAGGSGNCDGCCNVNATAVHA